MGKNPKRSPPRRPVKAKGTIPAPKVTPRRTRRVWYKQRQVQIVGGIVLLALLGFGVQQFFAWRSRSKAAETERRAVTTFFNALQILQTDREESLRAMAVSPDAFKNGQITAEDYKAQAQKWLSFFQRMASELRSQSPPASLLDVRARFVESTVIYIDAVRTFQMAAQATDVAVRDQAILLGQREAAHAGTIFENAVVALQKERVRVGLAEEGEARVSTPSLPEEDVQPGTDTAPPAQPPPAPPSPSPAGSPQPSPAKS